MKKKLVGLATVGLLTLGLVACNQEPEQTTQPAEITQNAVQLLVTGDTIDANGCILDSRFTVGDRIVWRIDVTDPVTGEQAKDAKVTVELSTGETLDMVYSEHPPGEGNPAFWTAAYSVTEDTPTGVIEYSVKAVDGDRKGEFKPFDVSLSKITIVDPSVSQTGFLPEEETPAEEPKEEPKEDEKPVTELPADKEVTSNIELIGTNFAFADKDGNNVFYVKKGEEVTLSLKNEEGTHGLVVLGLKDVAIDQPGGEVTFTPTETGEYQIHCNFFCGDGHGDMTATIVVVG